ncbi:hypothetical protein [Pseudobacteroides cellulosolvens]|uniref:Uncharacterized protein n=1 Tax=Pseudobacteroides cellulosolvens ATCC 35603 = DSM 2933 TaxID=398512 RepID=A0A0L6JMI1_9FIRM|nr:hypothetical protein [Pseudobacteroides cellulosolvens]KNY27006.1 hypothetical protein Bccel_2271 [Pseudobacteroides cellulosolvens ATCC 35603 = DSM 2933]
MKQKITVEDLNSLTPEQKQNLNSLWKPNKFDHAVASICKNIVNEEYEDYEFVIGNIEIYNGYRILLYDIANICNEDQDNSESDEETCQNVDEDVDDNYDNDQKEIEEDYDQDQDFSFCRPSSFIKDECLPLLTIGHMIEILGRTTPSHGQFYLFAESGDIFCEIGNRAHSNDYGFDLESNELCDVLWGLVKNAL